MSTRNVHCVFKRTLVVFIWFTNVKDKDVAGLNTRFGSCCVYFDDLGFGVSQEVTKGCHDPKPYRLSQESSTSHQGLQNGANAAAQQHVRVAVHMSRIAVHNDHLRATSFGPRHNLIRRADCQR